MVLRMASLREEDQAKALKALLTALERQRRADEAVRIAAAQARELGISVNRMATVAEVSRTKVYAWLNEPPTEDV
jgi:hypothetical protein